MTPEEIIEELCRTDPASVTMFTGAGVSVEGPASLPTGEELTRRVFDSYFEDGTLDRVHEHHRAIGWLTTSWCPHGGSGAARPPRLETVLGVAAGVHGHTAVADILADVSGAEPNRNHVFLAAHLRFGGTQLTANFDTCVEKAADRVVPGRRARGCVRHFHGSLTANPSGAGLGATLARIQGGFTGSEADEFLAALPDRGVLLVLGYSGGDFFDVDVAVAGLPSGALRDLHVVWVSHSWGHRWHRLPGGPPLTRHLAEAGARVDVICGPTGDVVEHLSAGWGLPALGGSAPRTVASVSVAAPADLRQAASFKLYRELGLYDEVAAMMDQGALSGVPAADRWWATSELLWEQGRWNDLRRLWRRGRLPPGVSPVDRAERIGACLWVQGRFLPAYLWLDRCHRGYDADERLTLLETEGRVVEHMARTPELRLFARRLAARLVAELGDTGQTAGVHLYRRRNDLVSSLRSLMGETRPADEAETSSTWFTEAGSLLAATSYRHRQLRDTYDPGEPTAELAMRYRALQRDYATLGSRAGYWRTHLLPGAERVFGLREVVTGVFTLQYGLWHRVRLIANYLVQAVRARLRA